jgi:hypothetical protein
VFPRLTENVLTPFLVAHQFVGYVITGQGLSEYLPAWRTGRLLSLT